MSELNREIGGRIRNYRKAKESLRRTNFPEKICKSKSTISKYEKERLPWTFETLYEIADAIGVHVEQLLSSDHFERKGNAERVLSGILSGGRNRFYGYIFDGRSNPVNTLCI